MDIETYLSNRISHLKMKENYFSNRAKYYDGRSPNYHTYKIISNEYRDARRELEIFQQKFLIGAFQPKVIKP